MKRFPVHSTKRKRSGAILPNPSSKSQSAMEYLMTYGWAILIIAIVMIAMFSLGVFNPSEPRVSAGACEVFHGSDVGECQGVWPQFVASIPATAGTDYGIVGPTMTMNLNSQSYTMCAWAEISSSSPPFPNPYYPDLLVAVEYASSGLAIGEGGSAITAWLDGNGGGTGSVTAGSWNFYCAIYQAGSTTRLLYMNGAYAGSVTNGAVGVFTGPLWIGNNGYVCCGDSTTQMYESNVQIYNTSLSQAEITALYHEGIGGAPIDPNNIVGWWPLNGNAQDYSGNGNNGQATGVSYTSTWTSGYMQP